MEPENWGKKAEDKKKGDENKNDKPKKERKIRNTKLTECQSLCHSPVP